MFNILFLVTVLMISVVFRCMQASLSYNWSTCVCVTCVCVSRACACVVRLLFMSVQVQGREVLLTV